MHELTHPAAMICVCGSMLYEEDDGTVICASSQTVVKWVEIRHSKKCVHEDDFWVCVKQCRVHRAQLKLLEA